MSTEQNTKLALPLVVQEWDLDLMWTINTADGLMIVKSVGAENDRDVRRLAHCANVHDVLVEALSNLVQLDHICEAGGSRHSPWGEDCRREAKAALILARKEGS